MNSSPGSSMDLHDRQLSEVDTPAAWRRLGFAVAVSTIGSVGMWSMPVALPFVQADFGITRAEVTLPYTLAMTGFALGGVAMGRLCDRFGVVVAIMLGNLALGISYVGTSLAPTPLTFALMHLFIGVGASATFGPLMADMSQWFVRHRGSRSASQPPATISAVCCGRRCCSMRWRPGAGATPIWALGCSAHWRRCRSSLRCDERVRSRGC